MKARKIGAILLIMVMVLTMIPLSATAATATEIKFAKTSDMKAEVGKNYKREAITTPEGAEVTYSSSDKSIATVDENGRVKAIAEGKAVITAKSGNVTASYNVNVIAAPDTQDVIGRPMMSNQPENGYATVAEAAKAWPDHFYYIRFMGPDARDQPIWRWWVVSYKDVIKNNPLYGTWDGTLGNLPDSGGFDTAQDVIAIFGSEIRKTTDIGPGIVLTTGNVVQNSKTGKWYYSHGMEPAYYFPTKEVAARTRGNENATKYIYDKQHKAWYASFISDGDSGANKDRWKR